MTLFLESINLYILSPWRIHICCPHHPRMFLWGADAVYVTGVKNHVDRPQNKAAQEIYFSVRFSILHNWLINCKLKSQHLCCSHQWYIDKQFGRFFIQSGLRYILRIKDDWMDIIARHLSFEILAVLNKSADKNKDYKHSMIPELLWTLILNIGCHTRFLSTFRQRLIQWV